MDGQGSKLSLDLSSELKSISSINMTHPSLEVLDKTNPRDTNPWEILDNKTSNECHRHGMMETIFLPIDIHEETPLELEKEDDIDAHGSYIMNTSSNPCSYDKSLELIRLSNITTHEIFNPSCFLFIKIFERVVIYAYVYHKYYRSRCVNLEIGT
jgi:endonuclease IV